MARSVTLTLHSMYAIETLIVSILYTNILYVQVGKYMQTTQIPTYLHIVECYFDYYYMHKKFIVSVPSTQFRPRFIVIWNFIEPERFLTDHRRSLTSTSTVLPTAMPAIAFCRR